MTSSGRYMRFAVAYWLEAILNPFRNISIGVKIFSGYTLVLLLLAAVGAVGWFASRTLAISAQDIYDEHLQSTIELAQAESALWELRWGLAQYIVTTPEERAKIRADEAKWYAQIDESMSAYSEAEHEHQDQAEEADVFDRWKDAYPRYVAARPHWFQLIDQGRLEEAAAWRAKTTTAYGREAVAALQELIKLERIDAEENAQQHRDIVHTTRVAIFGATGLALLLGLGAASVLTMILIRPVKAMTRVARAAARGDLSNRVEAHSGDELGLLGRSFNQMMDEVATARQNLEQQVHERTVELMAAMAEVEARADEQARLLGENQAQQVMIRELMSPVIPILPGVLVVPLVGAIDTERAQTVSTAALEAVAAHHAHSLVLDVTGVPVIDTQVGRALLDLTAGVRLLGAEVLLVGIRPEVAQSMVGLGLSLNGLHPYADLQSAVAALLHDQAAAGNQVAHHFA